MPAGDAAVAGFSGTYVLGSPAQSVNKTYINLDGPALRVILLDGLGGSPRAQLVAAAKPFTVTAGQIGQVFSLALDDASPPHIYAAATSAYGLPIVVPDTDGDGVPDRARRGAPNAAFMPGLFGPVIADGGPGSIWKIDGVTGAVSLFANVTLNGEMNSGPALGGLTFDRASRQLFVADRDTGMIHRFTLDGVERGRFDHGTQGLSALGLPPVAFDARKRLNIESPAFDSGNPATWAYAPPARRVFGLAVNRGRLYYAVASGLRIWSVSLLPDGSFGSDARIEVAVPRTAPSSAEVSEILFDDNGDMLVAERGAPTGAYDYEMMAEAGENRVLRFRPKMPDDPPSRDLWFPVPKEYAIGFPQTYRNDNGGIAIGYGYDRNGNIDRAVCGGTLWSTGEQLRSARDPEIVRRLQAGGPLLVDGLQGNSTQLLRPLNEPPFESYYIDYDDRFDDSQTRGHLGGVVIWRICGGASLPVLPLALPVVCPAGWFNVDGVCRIGLACPSGTEFANGCCIYRGCPSGYARINGRCVPPPINCRDGEVYSNGRCEAPHCPSGMVVAERKGASTARPQSDDRCPEGQTYVNEQCQPSGGGPKMCSSSTYCKCPDGTRTSGDGASCTQSSCGPHMVEGDGTCLCASGYQDVVDSNGQNICIPVSQCDRSPTLCCPADLHWNTATHSCDVGNHNPTPKLKITKTFNGCSCAYPIDGTAPQAFCSFSVSVKNIGTVVYAGTINWSDALQANNSTFNVPPQSTGPVTIAPGDTYTIPASQFLSGVFLPGSKYSNCAALGTRAPNNSGPPGPDISCVAGDVPINMCQALGNGQRVGAPPPLTAPCVDGAQRNSDGNCPTPPAQLGCPPGTVPVNDGTSCSSGGNSQICQRPKVMSGGKCACPEGTVGNDCHKPRECDSGEYLNDAGKCVELPNRKPRKPTTRNKPPEPSSETGQKLPTIDLNIGIGIGGGGGGPHTPSRMPTPGNRGGGG